MTESNIRNGDGHRAYRRQQAALKRRTARLGLVCWLCGSKIDTSLPPTDGQSFTADHIMALANGGHLVKNELRPAHRGCNSRRGNHVDIEIWEAT